jgi:hypothetical protein
MTWSLAAAPPIWYVAFWSGIFVAYCLFWIWHDRGR